MAMATLDHMSAGDGEPDRRLRVPVGAPRVVTGARTRSIWQSQLLLCAVVLVVVLVMLALQPAQFSTGTFAIGAGGVIGLTVVTLVFPWHRVGRPIVVLVPFLDILAIGVMQWDAGFALDFLWAFPVVWLGSFFSIWAIMLGVGGIGATMLLSAMLTDADSRTMVAYIVAFLSLAFLAPATSISARQTRAFKQLLRRQTAKLQDSLHGVSAQRRRVSQMFNALDIGVARLSARGQVLALNETLVRLYGLDPEDIDQPGAAVEYDEQGGTAIPQSRRPLTRARRGETLDDERVWLFDGEGEWRALSVSTRVLPAGLDEDTTILYLVHDVTALIESERTREKLATVVSHELRNPLTVIAGHTELALDDVDDAPQLAEHLRVISGAATRMDALIAELLTHARGGFSAEPAWTAVDLTELLRLSLESFAPTAEARGVRLTADIESGLLVDGDAFRLRQVIDNVLSNAIKYTGADGSVRLVARTVEHSALIEVSDTGMGIDADDLGHVFEPYFRARSAQDSGVGGTGLGMGIAREILVAHRGEIGLESTVGKGTLVRMRIPLSDAWVLI